MAKVIIAFVIGLTPFVLMITLIRRNNKRPKRPSNKQNKGPRMEFKKIVVAAVLATYFIGLGFGAWIVLKYDYSQLSSLLTYIGAPTTGAILSYCYVVRAENAIKLKRMYPEETEGYNVDLNNTSV